MIMITKKFTFDAAHTLPGHPGKCKNLHGHTYVLEVTVGGHIEPSSGMVMDFGALSGIVKRHVIDILDHSNLNDHHPNPTAENLLIWIMDEIKNSINRGGHHLEKLRLYETPDSWAEIDCHVLG